MACPSGCINGGGQIKLHDKKSKTDVKSMTSEFNKLFHGNKYRLPEESPLAVLLSRDNLNSDALRTSYHAVPKIETLAPAIIKW